MWNLLPANYGLVEYDATLFDVGFTEFLEAPAAFIIRVRAKSSAIWLY
jgi:hypothetical protein